MKSLMLLWKEVAFELATWCCTSATLDWKTVKCRSEYEGFSFLTITLPSFGKDFQKSLDLGFVDHDLFMGFARTGGLPRFLGGFLDRVFDRSSGVLLDNPSIDAIFAVRQLTLMFSKISLPCSDARERKAMDDYIQCEKDVRMADSQRSRIDIHDFERISAMLFATPLSQVDLSIYETTVVPKHGPGATADALRGNGKFRLNTWTARLEAIFPSGEMLLPNWRFYDNLEDVDILEPGSELPVRVISVPKTLKTPRIIGVEPTCMQFMQQAVLPEILEALSRVDFLDSFLGFRDQTPNQWMAREGSQFGNLATLDLSEASDRVSNQLVRSILHHHPHVLQGVDACRSRKADVPGHGVIRLAKFASMGSALTFPMEAMVFLTLVFLGIERELNTPLDPQTIKSFVGSVRIYGDDIIVPVEFVHSVVQVLSSFGMKVNLGKSYWNGKFRESCGKEYFSGHDVSIVKVRQVFPSRRKCVTEVISLVSLRNQLYKIGLWQTTKWLDVQIGKILPEFPVVLPTSPVLGRHSFLGFETQKLGEHLHNPLVRGYVVSPRIPSDPLDGERALLKFFLKRGSLPSADRNHLERAGRPHAVDIKLRWASAV